MTLRDLFRWAERYHMSSAGQEGFYDWEQCMCEDGECFKLLLCVKEIGSTVSAC